MRILFLTHRLPYAPNRGDRLRAFRELSFLAREHDVAVVSLVHDADEASHRDDLKLVASETLVARVPHLLNRARALPALTGRRPLTHVLLHSPDMRPALERLVARRPPDLVLAFCSSMARFALEPPLDRFPLVIDMVDADSAKWRHLAGVTAAPLRWIYAREARTLAAFEARAMRRARATFAVNERERLALLALAPDADVRVIENGVDVVQFAPPGPPCLAPAVVFCGVMDYPPNEAGAVWLAREVWPVVRAANPDAKLVLVGARPTATVHALQSDVHGITVTGSVPDVRPYLWDAAVAAAPLHVACGVQNKVLEAVAAGLPVVVTSPVWQGLPDGVRPACTLAQGPREFAAALLALLGRQPDERRTVARQAPLEALGWERKLLPLNALLQGALKAELPQ